MIHFSFLFIYVEEFRNLYTRLSTQSMYYKSSSIYIILFLYIPTSIHYCLICSNIYLHLSIIVRSVLIYTYIYPLLFGLFLHIPTSIHYCLVRSYIYLYLSIIIWSVPMYTYIYPLLTGLFIYMPSSIHYCLVCSYIYLHLSIIVWLTFVFF